MTNTPLFSRLEIEFKEYFKFRQNVDKSNIRLIKGVTCAILKVTPRLRPTKRLDRQLTGKLGR
jgi:hypothetical protein